VLWIDKWFQVCCGLDRVFTPAERELSNERQDEREQKDGDEGATRVNGNAARNPVSCLSAARWEGCSEDRVSIPSIQPHSLLPPPRPRKEAQASKSGILTTTHNSADGKALFCHS
jgi:hypothetical protein